MSGRDATSDAPLLVPLPPPAKGTREHRGLVIGCVVVVAFWLGFAAWKLSRPDHPLPPSIAGLFVRKLVEAGAIAVVTGLLLRLGGERLSDLGLVARGLGRSILVGLGFAAVLFLVVNVGINSVVRSVMGGAVDGSVRALFQDPADAPWWVLTAIVGGGFAEELTRAFTITRFERLLGRAGLAVALVVDSTVFGLGHLYQGPAGAVSAAITGLLMAFVFLRRRRVTDAMAAHAWFDLLGIAAAYALYGPRG